MFSKIKPNSLHTTRHVQKTLMITGVEPCKVTNFFQLLILFCTFSCWRTALIIALQGSVNKHPTQRKPAAFKANKEPQMFLCASLLNVLLLLLSVKAVGALAH